MTLMLRQYHDINAILYKRHVLAMNIGTGIHGK